MNEFRTKFRTNTKEKLEKRKNLPFLTQCLKHLVSKQSSSNSGRVGCDEEEGVVDLFGMCCQ
jgi:hypothetical protein